MKRLLIALLIMLGVTGIIVLVLNIEWDQSLNRYRKNGSIRIGYAVEAPYAFVTETGVVTGESPEVAKYIVKQLGVAQIDWVQSDFDSLIPKLESGEIDVIASGMFITAERAEKVNFSQPTFHVQQALLVLEGNPKNIHSYQQIEQYSSIKIAVLSGSFEEKIIENYRISDSQILIVPNASAGYQAVADGRVDGMALSSPTINWTVLHDPENRFESAKPFTQPNFASFEKTGYGGFAFRKNETQLLKAWNNVEAGFIGSPEHLALIAPFGFSGDELPGSITTDDILP